MNWRQNKILKEVSEGNFNTLLYYHKEFNVSQRSIRNDIKEINSTIEKSPKLEIDEHGRIIFANGEVDLEYIKSLFDQENLYTYRLSQEERQTIIAMILLNTKDYQTIASLSECVSMSRNTINNDMEKVKNWFFENRLDLMATKSNGFKVNGNEKQIRFGMVKLLMLNGHVTLQYEDSENSIFFRLLLKELDQKQRLSHIEKIINKNEQEFGLELADFSYKEVLYYCLVLVYRIENSQDIERVDSTASKESTRYQFARSIADEFESEFDISIDESEIYELVELLRSQSYIKNMSSNHNNGNDNIFETEIEEFIRKIAVIFRINFHLEFHLYDMLICHMLTTVRRVRRGHTIVNPLLEQLKSQYPGVFKSIKQSIKGLEESVGIEFCENEISFITMYVVTVLEATRSERMKINTVIVCNSGQGTAQLVFRKLQNANSRINVVDIVSSRQVNDMDYADIDLIVSTVALKDMIRPYILVDALISEKDFLNIQSAISEIVHKKSQEEYAEINLQSEFIGISYFAEDSSKKEELFKSDKNFCDLLDLESIDLDVEVASWEESIRVAGDILVESGLSNQEYTEAMIRNVNENGPYIVISKGVALPHALQTDGANEVGISLVRLKESVCFGSPENDPVKYVVALSLLGAETIDRPLYNFTQMLATGTLIAELDEAKTRRQVMQILCRYENEYYMRS